MTLPHLRLLQQSPAFRSRPTAVQAVVTHAVEILAPLRDGLPYPILRRELIASRRHPPDWLTREVDRIIEGTGVFRVDATGSYGLVPLEILEPPIADTPLVVIDLEATGGRPPLHRFIEVALVRREPDGREGSYASLANPRRPLPWYVSKITGLTARQVREAPPLDQVLDEFLPFLDGALLVFHGSAVDLELINYELYRRTRTLLSNPVVCTIALAHELEPELKTMGLDRVATHLGIPVGTIHRAWDDALLTVALFDRFSERFARAGIRRIVDLAFFQGKLPVPPFLRSNLSVDLVNGLPACPAAFVLRDEFRRVLVATATDDLYREMTGLFFPERVLPPDRKALGRAARFLEFRELEDISRAQEAIAEMLASTAASRRRRRHRKPLQNGSDS